MDVITHKVVEYVLLPRICQKGRLPIDITISTGGVKMEKACKLPFGEGVGTIEPFCWHQIAPVLGAN